MKNLEPAILYEDPDILAVNKPAGLLVHGDGRDNENTLVAWFLKKYPEAAGIGENQIIYGEEIDRSGIVHRLDKDTSGVMLLAKTKRGFESLKRQFQDRSIKKMYHAIVVGKLKDPRGIINLPIGRGREGFFTTNSHMRGASKEAETQYLVLKEGEVHGQAYSVIQAMPHTGRTHQIRVHMQAVGHAIVADQVYGKAANDMGLTRMALHAKVIEFENARREKVRVEAPYPDDFEKALQTII